jgi:hypothetical protein
MVRKQIGPVADFKRAVVVGRLPNTRSEKVLNRYSWNYTRRRNSGTSHRLSYSERASAAVQW